MGAGMDVRNRWRAALAVPVGVVALLVACTPTPTDPSTTTTTTSTSTVPGQVAPSISSFTATPTTATAPALVALGWSVSDPQGDALTCTLDREADGTPELTLPNCQANGSRNLSYPSAGTYTTRLTVSDGTNATTADRTVTVNAGTAETFDIQLQYVSSLSADALAAFTSAENRWESVIQRGIPAVNISLTAGQCLAGAPAVSQTVDDVFIQVKVVPDDGPGGRLAFAGPCLVGSVDKLPRVGSMSFDQDDVANLVASGTLDDVVLHEMGHVLGIGTVWSSIGPVLTGAGTTDPRYTGARGVAEWSGFGRPGTVPVEGDFGAGTRDSHWDEATFGSELMTGFISNGLNPLSRLTISSLADLGYQVEPSLADAYTLPGAGARAAGADPDALDLGRAEELLTPQGTV